MIDPLLQLTIALSLSLLFVSAGQHKRGEGGRFRVQLAAYQLMPGPLNDILARILPALELAVGLFLLIPVTRSVAGLFAGMLLVLYGVAVLVNLLRGRRHIDCGCGGAPQPLSYWLVLRNTALAGGAALLVLPTTERVLHIADALAMGFMTLMLATCYLIIGQLLHNQGAAQGWSPNDS